MRDLVPVQRLGGGCKKQLWLLVFLRAHPKRVLSSTEILNKTVKF